MPMVLTHIRPSRRRLHHRRKQGQKELIQEDCTPISLQKSLNQLLDPKRVAQIQKHYKQLRDQLDQGGASRKTADLIYSSLT